MRVEVNVALAPYTTFKIGGSADYFCSVRTKKDLEEAVLFCKEKSIPFYIFGGGSNLLVSDAGFRGLVIKIELFGRLWRDVSLDFVEVSVAAGESWDTFVEEAVLRGVYGIENLSGIPGSVGGTPIQNVGAYGAEVADTIVGVSAIHIQTGKWHRFTADDCKFSYRNSYFKTPAGRKYIISEVTFRLQKQGKLDTSYKDLANYFTEHKETPTLSSVRKAVLEIRSRKFPDLQVYGTAGSFFKNPIVSIARATRVRKLFPNMPSFPAQKNKEKIPAAWLIEHVGGFKGSKLRSVGSFQNQALVIVNYGNATSKEVLEFTNGIISDIFKKIGIRLEREAQLVGVE